MLRVALDTLKILLRAEEIKKLEVAPLAKNTLSPYALAIAWATIDKKVGHASSQLTVQLCRLMVCIFRHNKRKY